MPLITSQVTLGTAAVEVVGSDNMPHDVIMHNMSKSSNEYIFYGASDVSVDNAPHLDPGQTVQFTMRPGDGLYALSSPAGLELGILDIRKND